MKTDFSFGCIYLQNWVGAALLKIICQVRHVWYTNIDLIMMHKKGLLWGCYKGEKCHKTDVLVYLCHYDHISIHFNHFRKLVNCIHMGLIWSQNSCGTPFVWQESSPPILPGLWPGPPQENLHESLYPNYPNFKYIFNIGRNEFCFRICSKTN